MRILIGVDFSEESIDAARQGFALAAQYDTLGAQGHSEVFIAHIVGSGLRFGQSSILEDSDNRSRIEGQTRDFLQEHLAQNPGDRLDYTLILEEGHARHKLPEIVKEIGADWLFVGRSGSGALVRLTLGSTSQSLTHSPPCNLAIAHPKSPDWQAPEKLAVGVDFSKHSDKALQLGAELAQKFGAQLSLLHVIFPPGPVSMPNGSLAYAGDEYLELGDLRTRADAEMRNLIGSQPKQLEPLRWSNEVVIGYPTHEIVAFAKEHDIDALILGSVGRSAFDNFLLGSVATGVVKHSPCTIYLTGPAD